MTNTATFTCILAVIQTVYSSEGVVSGCSGSNGQEIIADAVYACQEACSDGYDVCPSTKRLQTLGFTANICKSISDNNEDILFISSEAGINSQCASQNPNIQEEVNRRLNNSFQTLDFWGCSKNIGSDNNCGVLNKKVSFQQYLDTFQSSLGKVLCCRKSTATPTRDTISPTVNPSLAPTKHVLDTSWTDAEWAQFPFMVSLYSCGASILTLNGHNGKGALLTAAHCFGGGRPSVWIGCKSLYCDQYDIESVTFHQDYVNNADEFKNDIAIIFLKEPITYEGAIPVVVASDPMAISNDDKLTLLGYGGSNSIGKGRTGFSDTNTLEYAISYIVDRDECNDYYKNNEVDTDGFLCMRDHFDLDHMVSICNGDSGSPVMHNGKQIGLNSFVGNWSCDPWLPQAITYLPAYYEWIIEECGQKCVENDGHIGCYKDNTTAPALRYGPKTWGYNIKTCGKKCKRYKYFGLKENGYCSCDDDYDHITQYGVSMQCNGHKLGGINSNDLYIRPSHKQVEYFDDKTLQTDVNLPYGPQTEGHTIETCRLSCSHFKYFSLNSKGYCSCGNEYNHEKKKDKSERYGLFKNLEIDGIEIRVNCDNFLNGIWFKNDDDFDYPLQPLELDSEESYPLDDWTKTQMVTIPNAGHCGTVKIECENAAKDSGPAGLMIGVKYGNKIISSNAASIADETIALLTTTGNSDQLVISSQTSTTPLSESPYNAQWIWTCGRNGEWNCGAGVKNVYEVDLCGMSVADIPNSLFDKWFDYSNFKSLLYTLLCVLFVFINEMICCYCCGKMETKKYVKVDFENNDEI
eukprot:352178_1